MCIVKKDNSTKNLYKYYSCSGENERRMESRIKGEIFFASPLTFNDPYDCQLTNILNNTPMCREDKVKKILNEECFDVEKSYKKLLDDDSATIKAVYEKQAELLGILCLTRSFDNILMWSHYATNNGMCLEYDTQLLCNKNLLSSLLAPKIESRTDIKPPIPFSEKRILVRDIEYKPQLDTSAKLFFDKIPNDIMKKYWQKLKMWEYEKEFRIGVSLGGNIAITIPNLVKHIYLGCNVTMMQIARIWNICKKNNLDIPISIIQKENKGLKPVRISRKELENIFKEYKGADRNYWSSMAK